MSQSAVATRPLGMDNYARESAYEKYRCILNGCVKRNLTLIIALQLEIEDVVQDLSIKMLQAIDRYDESRCPSLPAYLYRELQYEILNMRRRHRPHGIVGVPKGEKLDVVYLDQPQEDGTFYELSACDSYEGYIADVVETLPKKEREVVIRKINGETIRKKEDRECLARAREMLAVYFEERTHGHA